MFASGSPDNIKQWKCPDGKFIQNLSGHNAIINCMAVNAESVLVSGGDNGTLHFWDWRTGKILSICSNRLCLNYMYYFVIRLQFPKAASSGSTRFDG